MLFSSFVVSVEVGSVGRNCMGCVVGTCGVGSGEGAEEATVERSSE